MGNKNPESSTVKQLINKIVVKISKPVEGEENVAVDTELIKKQGLVYNPSEVNYTAESKTAVTTDEESDNTDSDHYDIKSSSNIDHKLQAYINDSRKDYHNSFTDTNKKDPRPKVVNKKANNNGQLTKKQKANARKKHERLRKRNLKKERANKLRTELQKSK